MKGTDRDCARFARLYRPATLPIDGGSTGSTSPVADCAMRSPSGKAAWRGHPAACDGIHNLVRQGSFVRLGDPSEGFA